MNRGYTFVMVDLRGFGGSTGCLDWGGPGEQADVKAAVEWAASQPWSSGKVGMYGKSYDGVTGLIGIAQQPKGLAAVVAQEPVYDLYRYLYANRVRFLELARHPGALRLRSPSRPDRPATTPSYNQNSLQMPDCPAKNWRRPAGPEPRRRLLEAARPDRGHQGQEDAAIPHPGLLENNTKPDGASDLCNGIAGPKRAWFGMWDHVRGNDVGEDGRLAMGRTGWFDEVDALLRPAPQGAQVEDQGPAVVVQSSDGTLALREAHGRQPTPRRAAAQCCRAVTQTTASTTAPARAARPTGSGSGPSRPRSPTPHTWPACCKPPSTWTPRAGRQPRGGRLRRGPGGQRDRSSAATPTCCTAPRRRRFDLYGNDWKLPAGHRLGVLVTGSNAEWWTHTPTFGDVTVKGGSVTIPFLSCKRRSNLAGSRAIRLDEWLDAAPFTVDAETIKSATSPSFNLPPKLKTCRKPRARKRRS